MDDWKNELTPVQQETIAQLRKKVADVLQPRHDDFFLWRWLKARNFDVSRAEQMLRNSLQWRASYGADNILEDWNPPEVMTKFWPGGIFGCDKEGHPILWQLCKDFDSRGMLKCVKKSDIVKYHIYRMEKMMQECEQQTKKQGKRIYNALHISDLDGLSFGMVFAPGISDAMKEVFALYEQNYPENLLTSYVINAPGIFPVIFNILRPFLSEDTKRKVHILGRNWQSELFKVVDPEVLPVHWGGTQRVPDDHCTDHITAAKKISQEYFMRETIGVEMDELKTLTVIRGNVYNLQQPVSKAGTVISWVFKTDGYDVSFGIYYCETKKQVNEDSKEEMMPPKRVNSHMVPEDGIFTCPKAGIYVLRFDNSYSWVTNKNVLYKLEVTEPSDDDMFRGNLTTDDQVEITADEIDATHL